MLHFHWTSRLTTLGVYCLIASSVAALEEPRPSPAPSEKAVYSARFHAEMLSLTVDGDKAFLLKPSKPRADGTKPWVWYAPAIAARHDNWRTPNEHNAWLFRGLLESGFHVAGIDVGESYGSPAGRLAFERFYGLLVRRHRLSEKAVLLPQSRGGLMLYNWAAEHPGQVAAIGGIFPVCNLSSYPGLAKAAPAYGLSVEQLEAHLKEHNPLDRLAPLAAAKIPILHLHGDSDRVVPLPDNSGELARRYAALGGRMELVAVKGKGHEHAPEFFRSRRLLEFLRGE